jgi:hypothetical protein
MDPLNPAELYKKPPPAFGHAVLPYFCLDPNYINLNQGQCVVFHTVHLLYIVILTAGSFGSLPKPVLSVCNALTLEIEKNPDHFHRLAYQAPLVSVRERLAQLIGAETDECVIVPNASHGINTVLRNFEWHKDDIIVACRYLYFLRKSAPH